MFPACAVSRASIMGGRLKAWAAPSPSPSVGCMTLIVCPLHEVEDTVSRHRPSHILTLIGPTAELPLCESAPDARRLHLLINDIAEATEGQILATEDHIQELIDFGRDWDQAAPMLVHCWAGISRSTAAAYILATDRLGPGSELRLARALRKASPTAYPNRHLIRLADEALGRRGAMVIAINEIGRGVSAPAGKTFQLKLS